MNNFSCPKKTSIWLRLNSFIILVSLLAGCQSNKSLVGGYFEFDTDIEINFVIDADINPDEQGIPSPLFVRMYELKSTKMMKKADFISLYEKDKATLGADLVGEVHNLKRFKPGENRADDFVLDKKTQYVALYAEFLEFKDSKFKLVIPVVANNVFRNSVVIRISENQMSLVE
jgi:type VI secretion system protein VasD